MNRHTEINLGDATGWRTPVNLLILMVAANAIAATSADLRKLLSIGLPLVVTNDNGDACVRRGLSRSRYERNMTVMLRSGNSQKKPYAGRNYIFHSRLMAISRPLVMTSMNRVVTMRSPAFTTIMLRSSPITHFSSCRAAKSLALRFFQ